MLWAVLEGRLISVLKTVVANHLQALPRDTCSVSIFKMAAKFKGLLAVQSAILLAVSKG